MMSTEAKFWDGIAEKYAAKPVGNVTAFERKKAITREHLRPGSTVLEIGCGTGSLALEMSPFAGHIHAMDLSSEMIRIANQKKQVQGATNVTFRQGTLDGRAPYESEHFDSAWAYSILHLVPDRRRTLKTIFDLLKPGGSFISSNVCLGSTWVPYGAIITVLRWFGMAPVVYVYDRETILREMREVGFVEIEEREVGAGGMVAFIVTKKPG
ncbi:SAM-dependent methyltransferase [Sorangium cellulosum]|uniref:SAM-dependent methyltransferase n=1 Tax=Sorangium cellulosum TaxID=56 RepID=A0A2L0EHN4_SORCE|nr:class I SAM-dependent methyltransferase [Sorangium cellulosum]AUX38787.1 SAM-dependent methyltransferase [Sorangium cellulosum]